MALNRYLRIREVVHVTGLSRTVVYDLVKRGEFPAQKRLSPGAVGWLSTDIEAWMQSRELA